LRYARLCRGLETSAHSLFCSFFSPTITSLFSFLSDSLLCFSIYLRTMTKHFSTTPPFILFFLVWPTTHDHTCYPSICHSTLHSFFDSPLFYMIIFPRICSGQVADMSFFHGSTTVTTHVHYYPMCIPGLLNISYCVLTNQWATGCALKAVIGDAESRLTVYYSGRKICPELDMNKAGARLCLVSCSIRSFP